MQASELYKDKVVETYSHSDERGPSMLYINLDEKCNENCAFCVVKGTNTGMFGSMDKEEVKKTIKDFINNKGTDIVFTGGEPTLRDDLPEIIEFAQKFKSLSSISIITNGTRISDEKYLNKLLFSDKRKIISFSISLHSHYKNISEQLTRVDNTFNKTVKGIENVIKNGRNVTIYQVITSKNYKDLYDFVRFVNLKFPQIRNITLAYPFPQGNALLNDWIYLKFSDLRPYLIKTLKYLEKEKFHFNIASCGQFPLCTIPGFEEAVLDSLHWGEQNISGVVGEKAFHEYEMMSPEWVSNFKNKNQKCIKCILNHYCQGFFDKYIELFGFNGIKTITQENFQGNRVSSSLISEKQLQIIISKIVSKKMNLIIIDNYSDSYLKKLLIFIKSNKIFTIITNKNNVIYPK